MMSDTTSVTHLTFSYLLWALFLVVLVVTTLWCYLFYVLDPFLCLSSWLLLDFFSHFLSSCWPTDTLCLLLINLFWVLYLQCYTVFSQLITCDGVGFTSWTEASAQQHNGIFFKHSGHHMTQFHTEVPLKFPYFKVRYGNSNGKKLEFHVCMCLLFVCANCFDLCVITRWHQSAICFVSCSLAAR